MLSIIVVLAHVLDGKLFWAWGCMEIFFVISGFLITRQILQFHGCENFYRTYFLRRAARIWPAYYFFFGITLAANLVWDQLVHGDPWYKTTPLQIIAPIFFVQNVAQYFSINVEDTPYHFSHSWSLAIEEQFYLLAPLIVPGLYNAFRRNRASVLLLLGFVVLGAILFRVDHSYWLLLSRLDGFVMGIATAFITHIAQQRSAPVPAGFGRVPAFLTFFAAVVIGNYVVRGYTVGFTDDTLGRTFTFSDPVHLFLLNPYVGFALLGSLVVYRSSLATPSHVLGLLRLPLLLHLGKISYSTYLCHVLIVRDLLPRLFHTHGTDDSVSLLQVGLSLTLSFGLAHLAYVVIEAPFLKRKPRFSKQRMLTGRFLVEHESK